MHPFAECGTILQECVDKEKMKMSDTQNTVAAVKKELLTRLGHDADIFVLISLCTREPYVVCDPETFDDEVLLYLNEEEAKTAAAGLAEQKIPVSVAKVNGKDMLVFFTSLYAMGVNALINHIFIDHIAHGNACRI